jgi:hypothetical protein
MFKEWAIVVDALGRGEQVLILRKGGISEGRDGFRIEHDRFWLLPTLFHQQHESVLPAAAARFDVIKDTLPAPETVRLEFFAEVADWRRLESLDAAERLRGQHIWKDSVIADRFDWGRDKSIYAMAVRVCRLPKAFEQPMLKEYGGCKSWVELNRDLGIEGSEPVLSDDEFESKLAAFRAALDPVESA